MAAICTPADYNTRPLDTSYSNFIDALPVVKYCSENNKRLIHFSTCEVYGKTIGSFLPKDHPLPQDPEFYVLKDVSPCILGSIEKQRWSYAYAKQLIERLVYAEGAENGLEFTIGEKVILVGHDFGGACISYAMELFPSKINCDYDTHCRPVITI